jgi:hypothetical protein
MPAFGAISGEEWHGERWIAILEIWSCWQYNDWLRVCLVLITIRKLRTKTIVMDMSYYRISAVIVAKRVFGSDEIGIG